VDNINAPQSEPTASAPRLSWWELTRRLHKRIDIYYLYLVAISTTLQASWADFESYVTPKARHWVIGTATLFVIADKVRTMAKSLIAEQER
jgi:hypothetical protein